MPTIPIPAPPPSDGPASTPSLRTLGTGATQAAAGNDPRFGAVTGDSTSDLLLTTVGATTVVDYTPATAGNYLITFYWRIITNPTNISITVTYTDGTGAKTNNYVLLLNQQVGSWTVDPLFINSTAAAITVSATAGTANQLYISSSITKV